MSHVFLIRSISVFYINETIYKWSSLYRKELKALEVLHGFTDKIIQSRREELLSQQDTDVNLDDGSLKKKRALLDILLCSSIEGKPLTNEDIREEVDTFMFAGHDTTTSGISFVFYCLAKNLEAQEKVYEEIKDVFGDDDHVTSAKLNNLHYLDLVIKESLRLYPPVPVYGRKINEELCAGGFTFPKDSNLYVSAYSLHRDPKCFTDPETFNPLRFETETTYDVMNPFSYVPFSAGTRVL
jgi:cytochrome P450 family 4